MSSADHRGVDGGLGVGNGRLNGLLGLTSRLSEPLTGEEVAQVVVDQAQAAIGAVTASLWIVDDPPTHATRVRRFGHDPHGLQQYERIPLEPWLPMGDAMLRREPLFFESRAEFRDRYGVAEEQAPGSELSYACLPLVVHGRAIGGVALVFPHTRAFDEDERMFLTVLAHHAAQALERASLFERERKAHQRMAGLQQLTSALSSAATVEAVAMLATRVGAETLGLAGAGLWVTDDLGDLSLLGHYGFSDENRSTFRRILIDSAVPAARVARELRPVWYESERDLASEHPSVLAALGRGDAFHAFGALPLVRDDRVLGVLSLSAIRARRFSPEERAFMSTIAELSADAFARARLYDAEKAARAAADEAGRAKDDFLAMMSHELRTPLHAILGFAQLMQLDKKSPISAHHRERVEQILHGGEHLLRLIDDVLDLSKIEAGLISVLPEPLNVVDVLAEVRQTLEPLAARHEVTLAAENLCGAPPFVVADRTRFAQILMNFGSNAIKYNRSGGSVTFALGFSDDRHVRVSTRDTGMGIPLDKQSKLFQPFQRAGQEGGSIQGTGIGLTITKRLAELMGGSVGFRSTLNEGSEFWVDMPAHASVASSARPAAVLEDGARRPVDRTPRLILYVEDSSANVAFFRDLVSGIENVDLIAVPSAELGVDVARARRPAIVVMDINLPGMSGLDALRALRSQPETKDIPVIALTAAASERDRRRGEEAGFARYLTKPLKVAEFVAVIESLLAAGGSQQPS